MKNYSINEDYQKINLMVKKKIVNKIKDKAKKEKTTIKNLIEEILTKKVVFNILCHHQISPKILS